MYSLEELPLVLAIEEAADVLRISRWTAYEQARIWRESGGRHGLRVLTFGRCLRVPRWVLEEMLCPESVSGTGNASGSDAPLRAIK